MARREHRLVVGPHQYGPGKTHRLVWSTEQKRWFAPCRGPYADIPHGDVVKEAVITCKRCLRYLAWRDDERGVE